MYSALAKQIADDAKKYEGKDNISSIMRMRQLNELEKSIKQTSKNMYSEIKKEVESGMKQIAEAVVSDNIKWGKSMGLDIKTAFAYVPKDVVTSIATGNVYDSGWSLSKRIWSDNKKLLEDVHSVVAKGIAANMTTYEIAKELEKYVDPSAKKDWKWSKVYPGTNKQVDYNAQRLARTLSNHAFQQAFVRTTKNNPFVEAYKWNTGHNHKTCQICINLAQTDQYGLGQGVFPKDKLPLDHPNGFCIVTAVIKKNADDIANEIADWVNGKQNEELDKYAKSMGFVPSVLKGITKIPEFDVGKRREEQKEVEEPVKKPVKKDESKENSSALIIDSSKQSLDEMAEIFEKKFGVPVGFKDNAKEIVDKRLFDYMDKAAEKINKLNPEGFKLKDICNKINFENDNDSMKYLADAYEKVMGINAFMHKPETFGEDINDVEFLYNSKVKNGRLKSLDPFPSFAHEVGHLIHDELVRKKEKVYRDGIISSKLKKQNDSIRKEVLDSFGLSATKNKDDIRIMLSEYSTSTSHEFIAEAYAEYIGNPKPRELSAKTFEVLSRKMNEFKNK